MWIFSRLFCVSLFSLHFGGVHAATLYYGAENVRLTSNQYSSPALAVDHGGTIHYGYLANGLASGKINVDYNSQTYHLISPPPCIAVPIMTSMTTPAPYVVSASNMYTGGLTYPPFAVFDRVISGQPHLNEFNCDFGSFSTPTVTLLNMPQYGTGSHWIQIDLGAVNAAAIEHYVLCGSAFSSELSASKGFAFPGSWEILGSNDGTNWAVLHFVSRYPWGGALGECTTQQKIPEPNVGKYRYYRLRQTELAAYTNEWKDMCSVSEWFLYKTCD